MKSDLHEVSNIVAPITIHPPMAMLKLSWFYKTLLLQFAYLLLLKKLNLIMA